MFINFEGIKNARDPGGIALAGGRSLRKGVLIRCAHLSDATEADMRRLENMGLRYIVDFRDGMETARLPDKVPAGADYRAMQALPTFKDRDNRNAPGNIPDFDSTFATVYENLAQCDEAREAYRGFFRTLLEAEGEPVLWHCTQGKDRTGVAAILLLSALGAAREDIEKDYFLSNTGLEHLLHEPIPEHMRLWPEEVRRKLYFVYPYLLQLYYNKLDEKWGGIDGYLRDALGLTDDDFEKLKEYYTE